MAHGRQEARVGASRRGKAAAGGLEVTSGAASSWALWGKKKKGRKERKTFILSQRIHPRRQALRTLSPWTPGGLSPGCGTCALHTLLPASRVTALSPAHPVSQPAGHLCLELAGA